MILLLIFGLIVAAVLIMVVGRVIVALVRIAIVAAVAFVLTVLLGAAMGLDPSDRPVAYAALFVVTAAIVAAAVLGLRRRVKHRPTRSDMKTALDGPRVSIQPPSNATDIAALQRLDRAGLVPWWGRSDARARARAKRLAVAWEIMAERADGRHNRVAVAKGACDHLLAMEAARLLPLSAIDTAANIRGNVPDAVGAWLRHATTVGPAERAHSMEMLVRSLEKLGARAEREIASLADSSADSFVFEQSHMDRRSEEDRAFF